MKQRIYSLAALLLAPLAFSHAAEALPAFTWDRVPVYAHCSYRPEFFKPEQFDFLATHFNFITFAAGTNAEVEPGYARAASEIKKRNPKAKVLFYFAGDCLHSPFTLSNAAFPKDGFLNAPAGKTIVDSKTGKILVSGKWYFDKSRADVREWWSAVAQKAVTEYGCDGVFADGLASTSRDIPPEKRAAIMEGTMALCKLARQKMGPKGLIIFNPLHGEENAEVLPVTDGAMIDNFDRTLFRADYTKPTIPDAKNLGLMADGIEAMQKASKQGKIVIFKGWPGFHQKDKELMKRPHAELVKMAKDYITFPLASFLIAAGPNCYFQYTWGWGPECGTFDWYPEFDKPLGPPKGDAKRDGSTYTREFEHASVFVDLEKKSAKIDWK